MTQNASPTPAVDPPDFLRLERRYRWQRHFAVPALTAGYLGVLCIPLIDGQTKWELWRIGVGLCLTVMYGFLVAGNYSKSYQWRMACRGAAIASVFAVAAVFGIIALDQFVGHEWITGLVLLCIAFFGLALGILILLAQSADSWLQWKPQLPTAPPEPSNELDSFDLQKWDEVP